MLEANLAIRLTGRVDDDKISWVAGARAGKPGVLLGARKRGQDRFPGALGGAYLLARGPPKADAAGLGGGVFRLADFAPPARRRNIPEAPPPRRAHDPAGCAGHE